MNQYEQYTVFIAREPQLETQENIDWAEVRYRLKNLSKPLLALGFICLLSGFFYLMKSNWSSESGQFSAPILLAWAAVSWGLICLSMKDVEPFETKVSLPAKSPSAKQIRERLAEINIKIKTTKDVVKLLEAKEFQLFEDIKHITVKMPYPPKPNKSLLVEKFFCVIQHSIETKCLSVEDDRTVLLMVGEKSFEVSASYYNQVLSGRYDIGNEYLSWLSNTDK